MTRLGRGASRCAILIGLASPRLLHARLRTRPCAPAGKSIDTMLYVAVVPAVAVCSDVPSVDGRRGGRRVHPRERRHPDVAQHVDQGPGRRGRLLARYEPRAAVPILIEALNETSEPVRRAAARGLWTIAQNENPEVIGAAEARFPRCASRLGDASVSVAMNAAGALERLGEPAAALADVRRKALSHTGLSRLRALSRGTRAHQARPRCDADALRARVAVRRAQARRHAEQRRARATTFASRTPPCRSSVQLRRSRRADLRFERELPAARPGTADLLRAMAAATPPPDHFARTLIVADRIRRPRRRSPTAYELMAKLDTPVDTRNLGAGGSARTCGCARQQGDAVRALCNHRRQDAARDARARAPGRKQCVRSAVRVNALADARRCERCHAGPARGRSGGRQACCAAGVSSSCWRGAAGAVFDEAARALRFTERDFSRTAAMYLEALKRNRDVRRAGGASGLHRAGAQRSGAAGGSAAAVRECERPEGPSGGYRGARFDQAVVARIRRARRGCGRRHAAETGDAASRRERRRPPQVLRRVEGLATALRSRDSSMPGT